MESPLNKTPCATWSEKKKKKVDRSDGELLCLTGAADLIGAIGDGHSLPSITAPLMDFGRISTREEGETRKAIRCTLVSRFWGMGVESEALPKLDFPVVKLEASETAGCRVGRPGFRAVEFTMEGGWVGGRLVICNGGMWGRLAGAGYSLSHSGKKKGGQEKREGLGGVGPLSQTFGGRTSCSSGLFSIPRKSRQAEPLQGNIAEQPPDAALTAWTTCSLGIYYGRFSKFKTALVIPNQSSQARCDQLNVIDQKQVL